MIKTFADEERIDGGPQKRESNSRLSVRSDHVHTLPFPPPSSLGLQCRSVGLLIFKPSLFVFIAPLEVGGLYNTL